MRYETVLQTVGNTPLVNLQRLFDDVDFEVFGKLEGLNPGGSSKDRPAKQIIQKALMEGRIQAGSTVIESSSGNMAIGLAQASILYGLKLVCVVDAKTSAQNLRILKAYGAEIEYVAEPDALTGEFLPARIDRVHRLMKQIPGSYWPNQYGNLTNSRTHLTSTIPEIFEAVEQLDFLFCASSTCGTVRGAVDYVQEQGLETKVIAVDAMGSVIFGGEKGPRLLPGMGAGLRPPLCPVERVDGVVQVSDLESVVGCRQLLRREAIFCGASSGGAISAVRKMAEAIPSGSRCAAILPDRGERYLETVFDDQWVRDQFGTLELEGPQPLSSFRLPPVEPAATEGPLAAKASA
ncbi:MAG: 2,3-diaminopropionate biosynthesis protein SbnA [Deltaproteobacteria bacterium]|nr:2,3-diaminopropionate biosynthesis protein SbnA [Deltaproteobacteria bacterium]